MRISSLQLGQVVHIGSGPRLTDLPNSGGVIARSAPTGQLVPRPRPKYTDLVSCTAEMTSLDYIQLQ